MGLLTRLDALGDRVNDRFEAAMPARFIKFYRSVLFQVILVGLVALAEPGIWTAINSLGAGGLAAPWLYNASTALTYGLMIPGCSLAGMLANAVLGNKWTLVLGAVFYTPYASSLYVNNQFGTQWYMLFGAALCGIGASLFWASEGAIAVGYPLPEQRGRYISIWMVLRNGGPLIGGAISCAVNLRHGSRGAGHVSPTTYLILVGVQCIGLPAALLLSPVKRVRRADGSSVPYVKRGETSALKEAKALGRALVTPHILALIPVFICGMWGTVVQSNFLATTFSVRTRSLASLLTAILNLSADVISGFCMDWKVLGRDARVRARNLWFFIASVTTGLWIWMTVTEVYWNHHRKTSTGEKNVVDYGEHSAKFNNAFALYLLWKFMYEAQLTFVYWLVGVFPHAPGSIEREIGILRSFESVGSTFSYVAGAVNFSLLHQEILAFALWGVALLPTTYAVFRIPTRRTDDETFEEGSFLSDHGSPDEKHSPSLDPAAVSATGPDEKERQAGLPAEDASVPVLARELAQAAP